VPAGGGTPIQLSKTPDNHTPTDYSPTLKKIIFHKAVNGVNKLFLMPVEGGNPQLFDTGLRASEGARWSPDGKQLAFISNDSGRTELYVISVRGGSAKRLTNSEWQKSVPSWSVDGKHLVYSMPTGYSAIYRVNVNLSESLKNIGGQN
jgi:TolB protein